MNEQIEKIQNEYQVTFTKRDIERIENYVNDYGMLRIYGHIDEFYDRQIEIWYDCNEVEDWLIDYINEDKIIDRIDELNYIILDNGMVIWEIE